MHIRYVVINPFPSTRVNGVTTYSESLLEYLRCEAIPTTYLANDDKLSIGRFRRTLCAHIKNHFDPKTTVIEAPEVLAASLRLPDAYTVHVRMHCPSTIVNSLRNRRVEESMRQAELEAVMRAAFVSSPSYGLVDELGFEADRARISVFKNPLPIGIGPCPDVQKSDDVIFLARFDRAKGVDMLNAVLELLPKATRVVVVGIGARRFEFSPSIRCSLEVFEHEDNSGRLRRIERAKVLLMLSRFENCPMTILESMLARTVVVAWDVGGIAEIAPPPIVNLAPFSDIAGIVRELLGAVERPPPPASVFADACAAVGRDFDEGFRNMLRSWQQQTAVTTYRGLSCRNFHETGFNASVETV